MQVLRFLKQKPDIMLSYLKIKLKYDQISFEKEKKKR